MQADGCISPISLSAGKAFRVFWVYLRLYLGGSSTILPCSMLKTKWLSVKVSFIRDKIVARVKSSESSRIDALYIPFQGCLS
jgi:hypothetical protein